MPIRTGEFCLNMSETLTEVRQVTEDHISLYVVFAHVSVNFFEK